jgi:glycosyl transferase, family 25
MVREFERAKLPHEFIEAVDGQALTPSERATLVDEVAVARFPGWLTPGAIGCALSHLRVYEQFRDRDADDVVLVLEDDVVLPTSISNTISEVAAHMHGSEVVLLYFRSFEVCDFSSRDAVKLATGQQLAYPLDVGQPLTASAYLITREACRNLAEAILPVRTAADNWKYFYDLGAIESLRCLIPRPITVRTDFKSTIGYIGEKSVRMHVTDFVTRYRIPPFIQLLALNRHLIESKMSKIRFVPTPSPIAVAHRTTRGFRVG